MRQSIFWQRNALAAGLLSLLAACGPDADCLKSNGTVVTQRRTVDRRVRQVALYDNVDLTIVPDTATYAEVRAGENVIGNIEFTTPGGPGTLTIRNTSRCNWLRSYNTPRQVRLHVARLLELIHRGYGRLDNEGQWTQDTLTVRLNSVGEVDLNLNSVFLFTDLYDAGTLTLRGQTHDFRPNLGSTGFMYAQGLTSQFCYFTTYYTWYGDAHVRVLRSLGGVLNGHGTLYYSGPPGWMDVRGPNAGRLVAE